MPRAYVLALSVASSLDQGSNNISLFQLVEQVNLPATMPRPPGALLPLEIHCYFYADGADLGRNVEMRFALVGPGGLETLSEPVSHRVVTSRYRTRTNGLPFPPALGHYELRVDFRTDGGEFTRDPLSYPISFVEVSDKPPVTH